MAKPEFLLLAHDYNPLKVHMNGWMLSEKIDGQRALWDGGISRGVPKFMVPWANNAKDDRFVVPPVATGLWSRYGNVIHAPGWFLDLLPPFPLDGELTLGRGTWQETASIIKRIEPDVQAWKSIIYQVFDSPRYPTLLADRFIDNKPNFVKNIKGCLAWAESRGSLYKQPEKTLEFDGMYWWLENTIFFRGASQIQVLKQTKLPMITSESMWIVNDTMQKIVDSGGEGLILRNYLSHWVPERSHTLLKHKPDKDGEGVVKGYVWGRRTDRGSKLLGLMGALVLEFEGKRLELSGFTDEEREMTFNPCGLTPEGTEYAKDEGFHRPGESVSPHWFNARFQIGTTITIKYRELSRDGIPKEARFSRHRPAGT